MAPNGLSDGSGGSAQVSPQEATWLAAVGRLVCQSQPTAGLPEWLLSLPCAQAKLVLEGMISGNNNPAMISAASSSTSYVDHQQASLYDENSSMTFQPPQPSQRQASSPPSKCSQVLVLRTRSVVLRDHVLRLALHAGVPAVWHRTPQPSLSPTDQQPQPQHQEGECWWDVLSTGNAEVSLHLGDTGDSGGNSEESTAVSSTTTTTSTSSSSAASSLSSGDTVRAVSRPGGRTWCFTMPGGFVVSRRVQRCPTTGIVLVASQPLIHGNCIDEFDKMDPKDQVRGHEREDMKERS